MKYQKIINFLDKTPNHPTRFMTRNWLEIKYDACGTYNTNSQIKLKLQCWTQVYVVVVMHIYLQVEL